MRRVIAPLLIVLVILLGAFSFAATGVGATVPPPIPTPTSTPEITSRDVSCAIAVADLQSSSLPYTEQQIGRYTGCARALGGDWIWPTLRDDPRLAEPIVFSDAEIDATQRERLHLGDEVSRFISVVGSQYDPFSVGGAGSMLTSLMEFTRYSCSYGNGLYGFERGAPGAYTVVETYTTLFSSVVNQVDYPALTRFTVWWINERASARPVEANNTNPMAGAAFDSLMYWKRFPWPFEMNSEYLKAKYYRWLLDSGQA